MTEKKVLDERIMSKVNGGQTKEEYFAEYRRLGMIDGPEPQHNGDCCRDCGVGIITFWRYQRGAFGNREAIYECDTCREYIIYAVEE